MGKLNKLRNIKGLHFFFVARDWFMEKTGLFALKKAIKYRLFLKRLAREDKRLKNQVAKKIMDLPDGMISGRLDESDFVLSLASHGKRVGDTLPYALYSLVTQTILPQKIVVYLDREHWSDEKLPDLLKKLQSVGVDFRYCEDLKSYKKLIPALIQFPNNPIITFDDDFYFHPQYISWMLDAYNHSDKRTVLGHWGCIPEKKGGKYIPYNEWRDCKYGDEHSPISFYGGSGVCYPPHVFDGEILRKELFMELCPKADDIWFWAMEERQGIRREYITHKGYGCHTPVDRFYAYEVGSDNSLTKSNVINGENDKQLRNVLEYYHLY